MEKRRVLNLGDRRSMEIIAERLVEKIYARRKQEYDAAHNLSSEDTHGNKSDTPDKPAARRMKSLAKK